MEKVFRILAKLGFFSKAQKTGENIPTRARNKDFQLARSLRNVKIVADKGLEKITHYQGSGIGPETNNVGLSDHRVRNHGSYPGTRDPELGAAGHHFRDREGKVSGLSCQWEKQRSSSCRILLYRRLIEGPIHPGRKSSLAEILRREKPSHESLWKGRCRPKRK